MVANILVTVVSTLCLFSSASAWPFSRRQALSIDDIQTQALANAYKVLDGSLSDGLPRPSGCTKETVSVRKEYGDLTKEEKLEYIRAVNCIRQRPSRLPAGQYPGATTRHDDFVVVHMNMTPTVHSTANFMHWHRYYIWAYETALKQECDFKGTQPYWNWGKYTDLPASPIFNGDETSLGGNGEYIPHSGNLMGRPLEAGNGGGCVTKGPLTNLTISLGPVLNTMDPALNISANPSPDGYASNPRCIRRDVNNNFVRTSLVPSELAAHITQSDAIGKFQDTLQMDQGGPGGGLMAIHSSGHYSIWGDPGGDVFVSPGEPVFYLHHAQLDRHWWMWVNYQGGQIKNRTAMYEGGTNWMYPTSAKGKPTDRQWLGVVAPEGQDGLSSSELFSTLGGPFCYVYQ